MSSRLARYGAPSPAPRPLARFLRWCEDVDAAFQDLPADLPAGELAAEVIRRNARRPFFMLEGLFRLYRRRPASFMKRSRRARFHRRVKAMEDRIGAFDYATSVLEAARGAGCPAPALRVLERRADAAREGLARCVRTRWLPGPDDSIPGVHKLVRRLLEAGWDDPEVDRTHVCGEMAATLSDLQRRTYDMRDLEGGVHEFRRDIRWFPIYCTALDGFVRLDGGVNPVAAYEELLRDPMAESPFATLAASEAEPDPVDVPRSLYIANTKYIAELGDLKDRGQVVEALAGALREAGVEPKRKRAAARAAALLDGSPDEIDGLRDRARDIWREATEHRLFDHLAAPFVARLAPQ